MTPHTDTLTPSFDLDAHLSNWAELGPWMINHPGIHLVVGVTGSGKGTVAERIAAVQCGRGFPVTLGGELRSLDDWLALEKATSNGECVVATMHAMGVMGAQSRLDAFGITNDQLSERLRSVTAVMLVNAKTQSPDDRHDWPKTLLCEFSLFDGANLRKSPAWWVRQPFLLEAVFRKANGTIGQNAVDDNLIPLARATRTISLVEAIAAL